MNITVQRSTCKGETNAPSSKSMTHRALVLGALANGKTIINTPLKSEDTVVTKKVLKDLKVKLISNENWTIFGGQLNAPETKLYCGESGTTLRFITAVAALIDGECILTGDASLKKRPIEALIQALNQLGIKATSTKGQLPVTVKGDGKIPGGNISIPGNISSQFISALLLVSPLADNPVSIEISTPLESEPYVDMTIDAMRYFGVNPISSEDYRSFTTPLKSYRPTTFNVEGDWSSAAFLIAIGVLSGNVIIKNLNMNSKQADRKIIKIIELMEGNLELKKNAVRASKSKLYSIEYDLRNCPDLFPIISALCSKARGESKLTGLKRLRIKESDRLQSMIIGLKRMGVKISRERESLIIRGGALKGASIDPYNDHRIAMSFGVLGTIADGETAIRNAECVSKSYPEFWNHMKKLGARLGGNISE
jgi:3-phosphoshikimate 1-carboxyvinyltransferase